MYMYLSLSDLIYICIYTRTHVDNLPPFTLSLSSTFESIPWRSAVHGASSFGSSNFGIL